MQQVSLSFHFAVEQRARSFLHTFFGFNGTAGVWRRTAMEQAGGWNMDSTVSSSNARLVYTGQEAAIQPRASVFAIGSSLSVHSFHCDCGWGL